MKKVLWISITAPYDTVPHAGGQIHNYYLKKLCASNELQVKLLSFCEEDEKEKIDLDKYGIDNEIICNSIKSFRKKILQYEMRFNPFNGYGNFVDRFTVNKVLSSLKSYKHQGYYPDIIILQWTQIVLLIDRIKEIFPKSKCIAIEEDVTLLGFKRKAVYEKNLLKKIMYFFKYKKMKVVEIHALKQADLIILNNYKDCKLIEAYGLTMSNFVWSPYYNSMIELEPSIEKNNDIIYYGSMERQENYLSAIWFIENIFNKLNDDSFRFVIIGNKPSSEILKYASDKIIVTGFVEDVATYFENALCLVAPLVLGAGIKIKVIESLSAGLVVLTNSIGIEGIPAKDNTEYFYCESPEQYLDIIKKLKRKEIDSKTISSNAKDFIKNNFNFEKSAIEFINIIRKL
jgi:glycosyltransferase involved in cell wall biosynthesis